MAALSQEIRALARPVDDRAVAEQVRLYLDSTYPDLAALTEPAGPPRRTLDEDIEYWKKKEADARERRDAVQAALPGAIAEASAALDDILSRAQQLSLQRYALSDSIGTLLSELSSSAPRPDDGDGDEGAGPQSRAQTLLEDLEEKHAALARSQAALAWASVLERILKQRDTTLDPANHKPSPLAALPHYRELHSSVEEMERTLPPGMALLDSIRSVRDDTWTRLKAALGDKLLAAATALKWPLRIDYPSVPVGERRLFERAYTEMLHLQTEGERMGLVPSTADWTTGDGLYPLQVLTRPIELRFKFHFQGSRNTNRVDKPEWGFANIQDAVYEHTAFIVDYLQPLTAQAGYGAVNVKSEFTMLLFPILLRFLRTRIPHLLSHPALLAHTVYQTVLFDDAMRENGFDLARTSIYRGSTTSTTSWEGLAGVILREQDWFQQWLAGEKKFAETSLNEIISSPDAWTISDARDADGENDDGEDSATPATESARQVRALIEQITDRYSPLPALEYRVAFLRTVQLPLVAAYHSRVDGSLDAFETLSSAFVRAVPGALGAVQRQGTDSRLSGTAGLERLIKAHVSADCLLAALRAWSNDAFFVVMSAEMAGADTAPSVWDTTADKYISLRARAEDMMVRLISAEVEADLKQHLTKRWDVGVGADGTDDAVDGDDAGADPSLVAALTSFAALISSLSRWLPRPATARVYRRVAAHLVNHISQRAVFAGWSKFTAAGGRALVHEVDDWRLAAAGALNTTTPPISADPPWAPLAAMAAALALPASSDGGSVAGTGTGTDAPTFAQAMAAAWGGPSALESIKERAGLKELDAEQLQAVLRRRVECWR